MTQKLEALHLEALCEEVRRCSLSCGGVEALWRGGLTAQCLSAGPAAENPAAFRGGDGGPGPEAQGQTGQYEAVLAAKRRSFANVQANLSVLVLQTQAEKELLPVRPGTLGRLREHMEAVILSLPEDLQGILHKPCTP